jgi:hypothetical protein
LVQLVVQEVGQLLLREEVRLHVPQEERQLVLQEEE